MNALNKQTLVALTNNSGSPASQGDVVILNSAADSSFVITSAAAQAAQPQQTGQFFTGNAYLAGANPNSNLGPTPVPYANAANLPSAATLQEIE